MNEATFPRPEVGSYNLAEWMRVLADFPPARFVHETEHVKPAVQGVWLARKPDLNGLAQYGTSWHVEGWTPTQWWQLAMSLSFIASTEPEVLANSRRICATHERYPREFVFDVHPGEWRGWRELAAAHGALRATLAMLRSTEQPERAGLFWAKAYVRTTKMAQGKPGDPISFDHLRER